MEEQVERVADAGQEEEEEVKAVLEATARTGQYWHDWPLLRPLLQLRMRQVLRQAAGSSDRAAADAAAARLGQQLDSFTQGAPFTLQRVCELLVSPPRHSNLDKLEMALQRLLVVTSTYSPAQRDEAPAAGNNGNDRMDVDEEQHGALLHVCTSGSEASC